MALSMLAKVGLGVVGASLFLRKGTTVTAASSPAGVGTVTNAAAAVTSNTLTSLLAAVLKGQQSQPQQQQKGGGGGMPSTALPSAPKPSGGNVGTDPWSGYLQYTGPVREPTPLPADLSKLPQLDAPALPNDGSIAPAGQGSLQAMLDNISAGNPILGAPDAGQINAADAAGGIGFSDPFGGGGGADAFAGVVVDPGAAPDLTELSATGGGDPFGGYSPADFVDISGLLSDFSISDFGTWAMDSGGGGGEYAYW